MSSGRAREQFSPNQCAAGRALLGWSIERLAAEAHVEVEVIELFEAGDGEPGDVDLAAIGRALYWRGSGVIALGARLGGEGVRFARPPNLRDPAADLAGPSERHQPGHWSPNGHEANAVRFIDQTKPAH